MSVTWPQAARAQSAIAAYRDAIYLFNAYPFEEAVRRIKEKVDAKQATWDEWRAQRVDKQAAQNEKDYRAANDLD